MPEHEGEVQAPPREDPAPPRRGVRRRLAWVMALGIVLLAGLGSIAFFAWRNEVATVKWMAGQLHRRVAAQRTERLALDISLDPVEQRLDATATLTLRSRVAGRRHFYFLLNPALRIARVTAGEQACAVRRVWAVTRVTVPRAPPAGEPFDLTFAYAGDPGGGLGHRSVSYLDDEGVLLHPAEFWYPSDAQSFFTVDLTVRLPEPMTLVTTGDVHDTPEGEGGRVVRQSWPRPLAGLALVAGTFAVHTETVEGRRHDVYVPADVEMRTAPLFAALRESDTFFTATFGPSGFTRHALVVMPRVVRAFNDGSGLMGLPPRYVRGGDYGYATIAHETAHNWWGALVAERWLEADTGGEWLVEGFAEMSALWAVERRFGPVAAVREMERALFPPGAQRTLHAMSAIDNLLGPDAARWTIYEKGGGVATLLRRTLGDDTFAHVCRAFCEAYRYRQPTDADFATVAAAVSGRNLDVFFARWVHGADLVDFAIGPGPAPGTAVLQNLGPVKAHQRVYVALDTPDRKAVFEVARADIGEPQAGVLFTEGTRLIADPPLEWPDVRRTNNVWPREHPVRWAVPAPGGGPTVLSGGFPYPWEPHVLTVRGVDAPPLRYEFDRAVFGPPVWWPDGRHLLVSIAPPETGDDPDLYWVDAFPETPDATTPPPPTLLGPGVDVTVLDAERHEVLCVVDDRIVQRRIGRRAKTHLAVPRWRFAFPRVAPSTRRVLCAGHRQARSALWVWDAARPQDARIVLELDRGRMRGWWLPDGRRAVVLHGRGDRNVLVVLDTDSGETRDLVTDMALIGDVLVTPDGRVAFTGRETRDYPFNGLALYAVHVDTGAVTRIAPQIIERLVSLSRPQWDAATGEIVCIREQAIREFSARHWARREVLRVSLPSE